LVSGDALWESVAEYAYNCSWGANVDMVKSFYKLPKKITEQAWSELLPEMVRYDENGNFIFADDFKLLEAYSGEILKAVYAMHRNDFLVKSNEYWLKEKYTHSYPDTLYYIMIDGEFHGAAVGKFRYTPEVEDVILDLSTDEIAARKEEILQAVHVLCGANNPIKRYQGKKI